MAIDSRWALGSALAGTLLLSTAALAQTQPAPATPAADPLLAGFVNPPRAARPQVWWHLMNGNVAKEGMDLDLDWLARMGIGGVHAFSGAFLEPTVVPTPLAYMSDGWRDAFRHAVGKARSLGMDVTIAGSPGWSQTGGPWVAPADGMKKYVWSETRVRGGRTVRLALPPLPRATGVMQGAGPAKPGKLDPLPVAGGAGPVIAFPVATDGPAASPAYSVGGTPLTGLADAPDDLSRAVTVPLSPTGETAIDVDFGRTATVRGLTVALDAPVPFALFASPDGRAFAPVATVTPPEGEAPAPQQTIGFAPTAARVMRVVLRRPAPARTLPGVPAAPAARATAATVRLLRFDEAPRIDRFEAKAGFEPTVGNPAGPGPAGGGDPAGPGATGGGIDPARVVDLTAMVAPDGTLTWRAPAGAWRIVRLGWSLTGRPNAPAEPGATGLEVDKLDAAAVRRYIAAYLDQYRTRVGAPLGPTGIDGLLTDSWEAGVQNWTPSILADFRRLRGYDPLPWLPTLAGYVVRDAAASDAFLADYRRTLRDLVVANHYDVLADAAHANGMTYYTEMQGDLPRAIADGLTVKGRSDIPTAEFWFRPWTADPGQPPLIADLKEAASAAHLYGRRLAAAESLTMAALADPWSTAPNMLKPVVDRIFAQGINRILIHDSHHQPFVDRKPGLQLALFGQWFNRNETWAEQARPWTDYLARTSHLLQQGDYVADVAFLYGEDRSLTDIYNHAFNTAVPAGYGFDYMDAATLRTPLAVQGGAVVTPSGMRYRVLYLSPDAKAVSLDYLRRLRDLVVQGAVLVGSAPPARLGLEGSDAEFAAIAAQLWPTNGAADTRVGAGRVLRSADLGAALTGLGVVPDVAVPAGTDLLTLHRRTADADIYFVSNQAAAAMTGTLRFRVAGRTAAWWSPETGRARPLPSRAEGEATAVDLRLDPEQSGFVVFRDGPPPPAAAAGNDAPATLAIDGPWDVAFQPDRGAPATARFATLHDWTGDADPGIRYFSGTATYTRTVDVPRALAARGRLLLDLGTVHELASVSVNGTPVATAWHAPYRVDLTGRLRPGRNRIAIAVTNVWANRLIGDRQPGARPIAYAPQSTYRAGSKLRPSGLIGPVAIVRAAADATAF